MVASIEYPRMKSRKCSNLIFNVWI